MLGIFKINFTPPSVPPSLGYTCDTCTVSQYGLVVIRCNMLSIKLMLQFRLLA